MDTNGRPGGLFRAEKVLNLRPGLAAHQDALNVHDHQFDAADALVSIAAVAALVE